MNETWTPLKRRTCGETLTARERLWRAQMLLGRATARERVEAEAALAIALRGINAAHAQRDAATQAHVDVPLGAAAQARVDAALAAITEPHHG